MVVVGAECDHCEQVMKARYRRCGRRKASSICSGKGRGGVRGLDG